MRVVIALIILLLGTPGLAATEPPAPLDLEWGMSSEKVRALGIALEVDEEDGPWGMVFSTEDLARLVEGASLVKLYFGFDDRLWRIVIYSRKYEKDPNISKVTERYDQINLLLAEKYGLGRKDHDINRRRPHNIARNLVNNTSRFGTYYDLENVFIALEIKALDANITYWMLVYAHKELTDAVMTMKKQREKNKL